VVAVAAGCAGGLDRKLVQPAATATLDRESPYLKVHLKDGGLMVLSDWFVDERRREIVGMGDHFDAQRRVIATRSFRVRVDDVALFETNVGRTSGVVVALSIMTGVSAVITAACIANPKSCFGSCPTFYVPTVTGEELAAEGFSASVAPALEARDVDHLYRAAPGGRDLTIRVSNEALETHVIRYARVLAAPRPPGGRVAAAPDGSLRAVSDLRAPTACTAAEGDCLAAVAAMDGIERKSETDGRDLATRETIELTFDRPPGRPDGGVPGARPVGLLIGARQGFLTTFLFYQALAYLGRHAAAAIAARERGASRHPAAGASRLRDLLGGIEVASIGADGRAVPAGMFSETGPLAADVQLFLLPPDAGPHVRLTVARGHYRIDLVALVEVGEPVRAVELEPIAVERAGRADPHALARLRGGRDPLVTLPGDEYALRYRLPAGDQELFLASRGYYLEWMRSEWLAEESPARAALMFLAPELALRLLAPAFRRLEPHMERMFWDSRFGRSPIRPEVR
jgi:hypothetical protein